MPGNHARLSPSSAHRWLACPGSVKRCEGLPDSSSAYADEGTAAHFLASETLESTGSAQDQLGMHIAVFDEGPVWVAGPTLEGVRVFEVDQDMVDHVSLYVDFVRRQAGAGSLYVEHPVPLTHLTGEPDAFGSVDALIVTRDGELQVHDLKYGQGKRVSAENNEQLMIYALGALHDLELVEDIRSVRVFIHQVRIRNEPSEWSPTSEELDDLKRRIAYAALEADSPAPAIKPGEEQCTFCRAAGSCPELMTNVADIVAMDFDDLDPDEMTPVADLGNDELSRSMDAAPLVETWLKAVRAEVARRLLSGESVPGYKLVRGKQGNRAWVNPKDAEAVLKSMRLKVEEMYDLSLISPTTAEKLAKPKGETKPTIGPRQWAKLQDQITRPPGGLSVAEESDPRPAESAQASPDDFDNLV